MSKKQEFIKFVEALIAGQEEPIEMNAEVAEYWEAFKTTNSENEKSAVTDNGKLIIKFLQDHADTKMWKAKDMAEEMMVTSRKISGSMRKLVTDGYVERLGQDPIVYALTEKGKEFIID